MCVYVSSSVSTACSFLKFASTLTDQEQVDSFYNVVIKTESRSSPGAQDWMKRLTRMFSTLTAPADFAIFCIKIMFQAVLLNEIAIIAIRQ